eukprot:4901066-Amphidinium_carterae.1
MVECLSTNRRTTANVAQRYCNKCLTRIMASFGPLVARLDARATAQDMSGLARMLTHKIDPMMDGTAFARTDGSVDHLSIFLSTFFCV